MCPAKARLRQHGNEKGAVRARCSGNNCLQTQPQSHRREQSLPAWCEEGQDLRCVTVDMLLINLHYKTREADRLYRGLPPMQRMEHRL